MYLFENALKYKINNKFILDNKIYDIIIYLCAFLALIYFISLIYFFIDMTVIQQLLPNDLIYFDVHAK